MARVVCERRCDSTNRSTAKTQRKDAASVPRTLSSASLRLLAESLKAVKNPARSTASGKREKAAPIFGSQLRQDQRLVASAMMPSLRRLVKTIGRNPPQPIERIDLGNLLERVDPPQGREIGFDQSKRQEGPLRGRRKRGHLPLSRAESDARSLAQLREHVSQAFAGLACKNLGRRGAMAEKRILRQVDAAPRRVHR